MKVLFRKDYEEEWEHIILYNDNGNMVDDTLEDHRLSALDILKLFEKHNIIKLETEEITE